MNLKNMRVIVVAALIAALFGSGVATAKSLIKNKDIASNAVTGAKVKNSSLTGADIKNRSLGIGELTKATQNLIRSGGTSSTSGKPGANGATGPAGPAGPAGAKGATGATGATGAAGASFDPKKVTSQTAQLFGFTPWYDTTDDASTVTFTDAGVKIDGTTGYAGVNLPIARGTSLSTIKGISYTQTGKAILGIEIYYRGGLYENGDQAGTQKAGAYRGDYTTAYLAPSADGAVTLTDASAVTLTGAIKKADNTVVLAAGATTWGAVKTAISTDGGGAKGAVTTAADKKANLDAALILAASLRTNAASATAGASTATISKVAITLRNAAAAVEYSFGS